MLQNALPQFENILFDGLSFYLFRLSILFEEDFNTMFDLAESLIEWAVQSNSAVIIVDPPVQKSLPKPIRKILLNAHLSILQRADPITFIDKGNAFSITRDNAIKLDHIEADSVSDPRIVHLIRNYDF